MKDKLQEIIERLEADIIDTAHNPLWAVKRTQESLSAHESLLEAVTALERSEKSIDALLIFAHQHVKQPLERELAVLKNVTDTLTRIEARFADKKEGHTRRHLKAKEIAAEGGAVVVKDHTGIPACSQCGFVGKYCDCAPPPQEATPESREVLHSTPYCEDNNARLGHGDPFIEGEILMRYADGQILERRAINAEIERNALQRQVDSEKKGKRMFLEKYEAALERLEEARATIAEANAIIKSLTCQPEDRT